MLPGNDDFKKKMTRKDLTNLKVVKSGISMPFFVNAKVEGIKQAIKIHTSYKHLSSKGW